MDRAAGNGYRKYDINRFNGDMLRRPVRRHHPGVLGHQLHGVDRREHVPWRHDGVGSIARTCNSARHTRSARPPIFSSSFSAAHRPTPTARPIGRRVPRTSMSGRSSPCRRTGRCRARPGRARAIAGGWQVAGVLIAQTGTPFTVFCNGRAFAPIRDASGNIIGNSGCDYNADNVAGNDRPNVPASATRRAGCRTTTS